jgi:hypothetical protein
MAALSYPDISEIENPVATEYLKRGIQPSTADTLLPTRSQNLKQEDSLLRGYMMVQRQAGFGSRG